MNDQYLVPANSKKSMLMLGIFLPRDLIIAISGITATILFAIIVGTGGFVQILIVLAPILICSALVMPLPSYHNVLQILIEIFLFFTRRRTYLWKGWCFINEEDNESSNKK